METHLLLLGLSSKEEGVLEALMDDKKTPLEIARATGVSRPTVYNALANLKKRGLVTSRIKNRKKLWEVKDEREIEESLYILKHKLLRLPPGQREVSRYSDAVVIIHRGPDAIKAVLERLYIKHKNEKSLGLQGDVSRIGWEKIFSPNETNLINRKIKQNKISTEGIFPTGWFERQVHLLGTEWAREFEGRTSRMSEIESEYFKHGGQMWLFKDSVYLADFSEGLIIEIKNSEINKMIKCIFEFMQDNAHLIDANALLRKLVERKVEE